MAGHSGQFTPRRLPVNCETHCVSGNRTHNLPIVSPTRYTSCATETTVSEVIKSCAQTQYALMSSSCNTALQVVFRSVVVAMLTYASSAWFGFVNKTELTRRPT